MSLSLYVATILGLKRSLNCPSFSVKFTLLIFAWLRSSDYVPATYRATLPAWHIPAAHRMDRPCALRSRRTGQGRCGGITLPRDAVLTTVSIRAPEVVHYERGAGDGQCVEQRQQRRRCRIDSLLHRVSFMARRRDFSRVPQTLISHQRRSPFRLRSTYIQPQSGPPQTRTCAASSETRSAAAARTIGHRTASRCSPASRHSHRSGAPARAVADDPAARGVSARCSCASRSNALKSPIASRARFPDTTDSNTRCSTQRQWRDAWSASFAARGERAARARSRETWALPSTPDFSAQSSSRS